MAGTQPNATPVTPWKLFNAQGSIFSIMRIKEKAADTQLIGTPCVVDTTGFVLESPAIAAATTQIAGFTTQAASNLTTSGVPQTLTYGKVPSQPAAVNIPMGAPINDGTLGFYQANDVTEFKIKTDAAHTLAQADIGKLVGLTKDPTALFWFADTTIVTAATGAIAEIVELIDPIGTVGGFVAIKIANPNQQFGGIA